MDLLLIGGVSGSGKSVALAALEDAGYDTVGNLPLALVVPTADHLAREAAGTRVAIALDAKSSPGLPGLETTIAALKARGWHVRFVFLDAKVETLVKRFSETRRRHPFSSDDRTLVEAIVHERSQLEGARLLGTVFDTSDLPAAALRHWVRDFLSVDPTRLALLFESFGFKLGVPLDADLVFDVRCLPNPHYEPSLAPRTGEDAEVIAFLERHPEVERMYGDIYHFVASWLPDYARDNRNYLTVAIGCTGGRHRSVYLVERLARAFAPRYQVLRRHRELG
ncbi:MAG: RNase adapter RapZ [Burkholderiales bacterium]|nr:RNase adapter RapZ [Burkholderiales bacterium]